MTIVPAALPGPIDGLVAAALKVKVSSADGVAEPEVRAGVDTDQQLTGHPASIRDVLRHGTAVPRRPAPPAPRPQPKRWRPSLRLLLAIVTLLLLLLAGTIAWTSLRRLNELTNAAATRTATTPATTATAVSDDPPPEDMGIGMLVSGARCTVFLVARDLVMTHSSCVNRNETVRVTLGVSSPEYTTKVIERGDYHALLQLAPDAGTRYRPIPLETRKAARGEPVRVLHHRRDMPSTGEECRVLTVDPERFELGCGSGFAPVGAPVLGATDGVLLGMHRKAPRSVVSLEVILRESAVLP